MRRDFDLIRHILIDVENARPNQHITNLECPPNFDEQTICHHVDLLINEKLIQGKTLKTSAGIRSYNISGLTWAGHDFLDASRDQSIWTKAKETVLKPGVSISFNILLEWLKAEAKAKLGLP